MPHYPPTAKDIRDAQDCIKADNGNDVVAIYNFLLLLEKEDE